MKTPFFSVICATYNRADLLKRALDSLFAQTTADWELIIIDDGSTDHTAEVVTSYRDLKRKVTYFYQENKGFIEAKNAGINKAKGKYITFLDSDDAYAAEHLAIRKKILETQKHIDFLHGGVVIIGQAYVPDAENPQQKIHLSDCFIGGTFFLNQKTIRHLKGFQGTALNTDFDFMQRAEAAGLKILKTKYPTYCYYRNAGSSITNDMLDDMSDVKEK